VHKFHVVILIEGAALSSGGVKFIFKLINYAVIKLGACFCSNICKYSQISILSHHIENFKANVHTVGLNGVKYDLHIV
jgi:membrane-anchored glycerophosphoryl diester phosphodiesterase (GDPDase)